MLEHLLLQHYPQAGNEESEYLPNDIEWRYDTFGSNRFIKYVGPARSTPVAGLQVVSARGRAILANIFTHPGFRRRGYMRASDCGEDYVSALASPSRSYDSRTGVCASDTATRTPSSGRAAMKFTPTRTGRGRFAVPHSENVSTYDVLRLVHLFPAWGADPALRPTGGHRYYFYNCLLHLAVLNPNVLVCRYFVEPDSPEKCPPERCFEYRYAFYYHPERQRVITNAWFTQLVVCYDQELEHLVRTQIQKLNSEIPHAERYHR